MGKYQVLHWVAAIAAALGRDPQTPEEALVALGSLLRSDPAEKERFLDEAHAAWVRGGWEVKGDKTPAAKVVLAALEEATCRLAERYGWQREKGEPWVRLPREMLALLRVAPRGANLKGQEGVFPLKGPLGEKAVYAAAKRLVEGKGVTLLPLGAVSERDVVLSRSKIVERAKALLQRRAEGDTISLPWGEKVRLYPGDRWEDLGAFEPRVKRAIEALWELLQEVEGETVGETEEVPEDWVHQTRVDPWLIKAYLGEEADGVEAAYLADLEVDIDGVNIYNPQELAAALGVERRERRGRRSFWVSLLKREARRELPTYGEVKEAAEARKGSWKALRFLGPIVAWEVATLGFKDPEEAYQEGLLMGLKIWQRAVKAARKRDLNPLVLVVSELRKELRELRAREVGVFHLSRDEARQVRKYFALLAEGKREDALKAVGGLGFVVQSQELSGDWMAEYGVEPREEMDYDRLLLREKVKGVIEEVERWWGPKGKAFVEALMEGQTPLGAQLEAGLTSQEAEGLLAFLQAELEGWAE